MKEIFSSDLDKMYKKTVLLLKRYRQDSGWAGTDPEFNDHLNGILHTLLDEWSTHNHTKRLWRGAEFQDHGEVFLLHAHDRASQVQIQVGIHRERVFLEMSISHPEHLLHMPDDFWGDWQELHHYGFFEIVENEVFSAEEIKRFPDLFHPPMSSLAELMRNLIVYPMLNGRPMELGNLSITWSPTKYTFTQIRQLGCLVFDRMFQLNQRLKTGK